MKDNNSNIMEAPTRCDYLKYVETIVSSGLITGCLGQSNPESKQTETNTGDESYSVTMEPMGTVEFELVPETWMGDYGFATDIGVALGQFDGLTAVTSPSWYTGFYDEIPGTSINSEDIPFAVNQGEELDKEWYYEIDPDVITIDPNRLLWSFDIEDINEINQNVAPFLGCRGRRKQEGKFHKWPDREVYRYYSLREQLEIYGKAFQEQERAAAMSELHRSTIEDVKSRVPKGGERPGIGLIWHDPSKNEFWVYNLNSEIKQTYGKKQYRDLNVKDAFEGIYNGESSVVVDYEVVLEHDPDMIFFNFGIGLNEDAAEKAFDGMQDDPIGSQLKAVQNGQLYKGGVAYQGPIINLFQTEMLAKQLYPEEFGEWQGIGETPKEEQLFDRQRLADIIKGEF